MEKCDSLNPHAETTQKRGHRAGVEEAKPCDGRAWRGCSEAADHPDPLSIRAQGYDKSDCLCSREQTVQLQTSVSCSSERGHGPDSLFIRAGARRIKMPVLLVI